MGGGGGSELPTSILFDAPVKRGKGEMEREGGGGGRERERGGGWGGEKFK